MNIDSYFMKTDDVTQRLINEIREGILSNETRLPPEVELAQRLGVSRNAIRESLARLEREGLVTRKHGVGTLINRHVFMAESRLDLNLELIPTLENTGKKAETAFVHLHRKAVDGEIAASLQLAPEQEVLVVERLICADGAPAIYCVDYIPAGDVVTAELTEADFRPSVFAFLKKFCGTEVTMNLAELRAIPALGQGCGQPVAAGGRAGAVPVRGRVQPDGGTRPVFGGIFQGPGDPPDDPQEKNLTVREETECSASSETKRFSGSVSG